MYEHLFKPVRIGQVELKNRIVMSPMCSGFGDGSGGVSQRLINYLETRARGGAGLIIVGITYVHPRGRLNINQLGISNDGFIPGLKKLTDAIHSHGAKIALQLHHGGSTCKSKITDMLPVAPSAVPFGGGAATGAMASLGGETPKALSAEEIGEIEECYADAAIRAKQAGFDGVELHAAHGYLLDQFLSKNSNQRTDEFGGELRNRARILLDIIRLIKKRAGENYPVWCRINGTEFGVKGGATLDDAKQISLWAEEAGADAIHVSALGPSSPINLTTPKFVPAVIADLAAGVKSVVSVPVIAVGKMTPDTGERLVAEEKADLIAFGRGHLADPEYANKLAVGKTKEITPCILCMKCRDDILDVFSTEGVRCSVNAALGKEEENKIRPTKHPKKVLVIGGGAGGMEAARVIALRKHRVTLWDKGKELGGQLIWAGRAPHKDRIEEFRQYLIRQIEKLGVAIETGKEATAEMILDFSPEALVLATGGVPFVPDIPGLSEANSFQSMSFIRDETSPGKRVLVIGGGLVGCEIAEMLADEGKSVTLIDILPEIACTIGPSLRCACLDRLESKKVTMLPNIKIDCLDKHRAALRTESGEMKTIEFDTILLATGFTPDTKLYDQLIGKIANIHRVGDCIEARSIREAVAEGYRAGRRI